MISPRNRVRSSAALLWDEVNGTRKLPVPAQRRKSRVIALNDHGVAVGSVRGPGRPEVPVYWRGGALTRLPLPRDADTGLALDNNNRGLIVGYVVSGVDFRPWWWRRGGRNGPLSVEGLRSAAGVVAVDDHDRVVGLRGLSNDRSRVFLWRSPSARPRHILSAGGVAAMDDSRHLVGAYGGFRGFGDRAWVARLGDAGVSMLPNPPLEDPADWWANTFARAIGSGVTAFAPQGGLTVAGSAHSGEGAFRAVLWTCAQTYLD